MAETNGKMILTDGSRIIIESLVSSGAEAYVGYPITPANLLYAFASQRFPVFQAAPDEITALQWVSGMAAAGKLAVTATSFAGFALMMETLNMAYMMELPLVIVLVQRLGPSTGSATSGAQGELLMLRSCISGGYPVPVFCPSDYPDCWNLAHQSLSAAVKLRSPVILLTSKEMAMTSLSIDTSEFPPLPRVEKKYYDGESKYMPYLADDTFVPPFLSLANNDHQVRINSSTHNPEGFIQKATPEALGNTMRLKEKTEKNIFSDYTFYSLDKEDDSDVLVLTYGITANAARDAVNKMRAEGKKVSLLILKTLLPINPDIYDILDQYSNLIIAEENISGALNEILFGNCRKDNVRKVNKIGSMISPSEIIKEVELCK